MNTTITVVILALNEEEMIARAIASAAWADEVLVMDGGSTDRTVELARLAGARIVERPFDDFARQRNSALTQAMGDWVLFCDADERITPELAAEVRGLISDAPAHDAYAVPRRNLALGRWLGWHPGGGADAPVRLCRRTEVRWDGAVHEAIVARSTGTVRNHLVHLTHRSVSDVVSKIDRYSEHEAAMALARGERPPTRRALLGSYGGALKALLRSGLKREGMEGAIEACLLAFNRTLVLAKMWERSRPTPLAETYREADAALPSAPATDHVGSP